MATMIPEKVEQFTTEGEGAFYRFLEMVAKPDNQNICWYTPDLKGKEPDFLFFSSQVGLVVFEVKDWAVDQIREADPRKFSIAKGRRLEPNQNPLRQARGYFQDLMDLIKKDGKLLSSDPIHRGKPKVPVTYGVVFPNINKDEYLKKGLSQVIDPDKVFFWDDLHPSSKYCSDPSGECFRNSLKDRYGPIFAFQLNPAEMNHLRQLLFPVVRIDLPERESPDHLYDERAKRLKCLDHHQEAIARKFEKGHWIITGPSGSGKTLVLVHKAALLTEYNSSITSILFVCYNITLVNYIRRLLAAKEVPFGSEGVQVYHFFELCAEILGQEIAYENEDADYYDMVVEETLEKAKASDLQFDAIMVDEGQDFTDDMFRVVTTLLNPKSDNLTIALDDRQDIYSRKSSWKNLGVKAQGRVHRLGPMYRNTVEIADFATQFIGNIEDEGEEIVNTQLNMFSGFYEIHGPKPDLTQFKDFDQIAEYVADQSRQIHEADQCPYSEIAILYSMKWADKEKNILIPDTVKAALESKGILCNWIAENYRSKRNYDITTDSVTISTIHSVKGLDYACVFLLGLDALDPEKGSEDQLNKLTYVALTRARFRLFIPYFSENDVIKKLKSSQY